MPPSSSSLESIASSDLLVFSPTTNNTESTLEDVIREGAFISNLPSLTEHTLPDVIFKAKTSNAVQDAIRYCSANDLKVCVRSGGHSWEATWLQGAGTALLDVGDLNQVWFDGTENSVSAGPGAKGNDILQALPDDRFFPCGHCSGVPVGGFLLGGGYGIGFTKYGMSSMLIQAVEVVLADGSIVMAHEGSEDTQEKAIMKLVKGAYTCFPGVITKYVIGPLPKRPKGVMSGAICYDLQHWKHALDLGLKITGSSDPDVEAMEVNVVLTHASPELKEKSGVKMVAMAAIMIWADTPEEGMDLWKKYTREIRKNNLPVAPLTVSEPALVSAESVPGMSVDFYPPKARYKAQAHMLADSSALKCDRLSTSLSPLVEMWLSEEEPPPPPPSHTLLVCIHGKLQSSTHQEKQLALGYTPSLGVQTYAIYQDPSMDQATEEQLERAHSGLMEDLAFKTSLVEGRTRKLGIASGFTDDAFAETVQLVKLLDPLGLFKTSS